MNVIIHADCNIILKYHTCTHNLICQVRMKPKLKQTVFRVNGGNQMRQELPVLLVGSFHVKSPRVPHDPFQMFPKKLLKFLRTQNFF